MVSIMTKYQDFWHLLNEARTPWIARDLNNGVLLYHSRVYLCVNMNWLSFL